MKLNFLAGLFLSASLFGQAPQFTIQDLGSLKDYPACTATAISQSGNVVGYCAAMLNTSLAGIANSPTVHAFLYSNGTMQDLNLTGQPTPLLTGINDSGTVAGAFININLTNGASSSPFVLQNGTLNILAGPLQGLLPLGLNNSGQMAGTLFEIFSGSFNFFLNSRAVLTPVSGVKPTTLVPPPGTAGNGAAFGLSQNNGWVAGASIAPNASSVGALLWQNGKAQLLPGLAGFAESAASAVNDTGMAAGYAFDMNLNSLLPQPGSDAHAVLFNNGTSTDLGVVQGDRSSLAMGINNSGWVVGFSSNQPPPLGLHLAALLLAVQPGFHAFLYANGRMYDLTKQVTNGQGWQLAYAVQVNDAGQIVGTGIFQDPAGPQQRAFLLTPVPSGPQISGVEGAGLSVPPAASISSNSLFSLFGNAFAASGVARAVTTADLVNNALPTNLADTCVQGGTTRWGLTYVSPTQINALAGDLSAAGSTVPVSVITNCGSANEVPTPVVNVPVAATVPEFLVFHPTNAVAAIEAISGALIGSPGLLPGDVFTPARDGDILTAFGVGWGATSSTDPIGMLASAAASLSTSYSLTLGGQPAQVSYAGLTPGFAGLYQVNFTVPAGLGPGNRLLVLTVNGVATPPGPYITVGP
jgi:uncharacterized protein (TIGR03437 family)